jgi:hypothetical protein
MIERHSGKMQIVCDCGFAQARIYEADEFDVMVSDARSEGFVITKSAGEWQHSCEACARAGRRQARLL